MRYDAMRSGTFIDDFTRSTTLQYRVTGEKAAMTVTIVDKQEKADLPLSGWRLEFEITGRCQLACIHCYADSGPAGDHGTMTEANWRELISDARRLGVSQLQLIGGEPTMHPRFTQLLRHAIDSGLPTEVFSNLVQVRDEWWDLYAHPSVSLATSYYSDQAPQHEAVTGRQGSHTRTRMNIIEAVRRKIRLRVGIIGVTDGQRVEQSRAELVNLGVTDIGTDFVRGVGRGRRAPTDASQLCGRCGCGLAAISPTGEVWPCVLSRWMRAGNVQEQPLADILTGHAWERLVARIPGPAAGDCSPDSQDCTPNEKPCKPQQGDSSDCAPAERPACNPRFCQPDTKK
ncbi:radical SAM protein [Streptosporangium sp. KLBMP 9127]|nr:radical SAM protein [Streptosporangium sp. KLBMP 9127]